MKHYLFLAIAALALCSCSQNSEQQNHESFQSTIVNPDGTVTFRYQDANAKSVKVDVQFAGRHDMVLDSVSGIWSATLGPAAPDMYPYCFIVNGQSIMDPHNQQWFPNEGFKNSLLDIPGSDANPLAHSIQDVPHGQVDYIKYYSSAIGTYNNAVVYLPPSYQQDTDRSYPVFYLISGTTDTHEVYYKVGRMNYIADNLIAKGEAKEMIIVLPYGNPVKLMADAPVSSGVDNVTMNAFGNDFINDLMPYVESHYRTINDRDNRAIGGFSRGGNQGLSTGLTNLDKFSYLCSYSSFTSTELPYVYDHPQDTNSKLHLFWTGVGTDDFLYGTARKYTEFLDKKGITVIKEYTSDKFGHTWMNAKYFLDHTLRLLFNPEASAQAMAAAEPTKAATGQETDFTPGAMARMFPKPIVSPEYDGNNVTLRIKAPEATQVLLEGEMLSEPMPMQRDSDGIWSSTVLIPEPDVYCYNFVVDGITVCDNLNMYLAPDFGFKRSVLNMPNAPFGANCMSIDYSPVSYKSGSCSCCPGVYATVTPRVCDASDSLPLVALIADSSDTFESWINIAHANLILDQLVAQGKCKPCQLFISNQEPANASLILHSANYKTWKDARRALVSALCEM